MDASQKSSFEFDVLRVACAIGLLRSVIEVVIDLLDVELLPNFYLDLTLVVLFASTLIVLGTKHPFKNIILVFYIPFIILLTIMFLDARGLSYAIENNVFAGLIIITFTTRGIAPLYLNGLLFISIIASLISLELQYHMLDNFVRLSSNDFNFLFSSIGVIAFTFYAKWEFNKSKKKLAGAIKSMDQKNESLEAKNKELLDQKEVLEELTVDLDKKVRSDSKKLKTQQRQVEEYLSITLTELFDAYQETIDAVEQFGEENDHMASMMLKSGENLKQEMEALRNKIEESIYEVD